MNMQRFAPYLGILAAVLLYIFIVAFSGVVTVVRAPVSNTPVASSTLSVEPGFTLPTITLPSLEPAANTPTSTTAVPKKIVPPAKKPAPVPATTPAPVPVVAPAPITPSGSVALDAAASALRGALVNIICYVPLGSGLHSISGSGIFIDSKGIILTNAHVAQYFLLADRGTSCTIRAGSPARDGYEAKLIFISPAWLKANATVLTQTLPSGTGEYDFALLAVSSSATSLALPPSFPSLPLASVPPQAGTPVVIATYGAQFLDPGQIQSGLSPTVVFGSVKDVFTFGTNTIDVLALGGSAAAQEGSSGGGVADASGSLVGTITTSTVSGDTSTRSLDAITASYIRAEYANETGQALDLLLAKPTSAAIAAFASQLPTLEAILTANL